MRMCAAVDTTGGAVRHLFERRSPFSIGMLVIGLVVFGQKYVSFNMLRWIVL